MTAYTYIAKPGGFAAERGTYYGNSSGVGGVKGLANSVVFTWAFVELIYWFWIYSSLKEERKNAAARMLKRRQAEGEQY